MKEHTNMKKTKMMLTVAAAAVATLIAKADPTASSLVAEGKYAEALMTFDGAACTNLVTTENWTSFYNAAFETANSTMMTYCWKFKNFSDGEQWIEDCLTNKRYWWANDCWSELAKRGNVNETLRWKIFNAIVNDPASTKQDEYVAFYITEKYRSAYKHAGFDVIAWPESQAAAENALEKGKLVAAAFYIKSYAPFASKDSFFDSYKHLSHANAEQRELAIRIAKAILNKKDIDGDINICGSALKMLSNYEVRDLGRLDMPESNTLFNGKAVVYWHWWMMFFDDMAGFKDVKPDAWNQKVFSSYLDNVQNLRFDSGIYNELMTFADRYNKAFGTDNGYKLAYEMLDKNPSAVVFQVKFAKNILKDVDKFIDSMLKVKTDLTAKELEEYIPFLNGIDIDYRAEDIKKILRNLNARYTIKLYDDRDTWEPIISKIRAMIDVR